MGDLKTAGENYRVFTFAHTHIVYPFLWPVLHYAISADKDMAVNNHGNCRLNSVCCA